MKIKNIILTLGLIIGLSLALVPATVGAVSAIDDACTGGAADTALCKDKDSSDVNTIIGTIVNTLLYILGAVSVIVIIYAGISYTISGGESAAVTKAKNTLMYAVVGLVVAVLAYAIVNYVLNLFHI